MSPHFYRSLLAIWFALAVSGIAMAQETADETETTPASERTYHDLRRSKDRTTQRFAERYSYLVRAQEWTSLSGKSKVMARYVSHTPDLKQVTLAVAKGSGANRVVREVTVEVEQLSKTCQSRVRQIDTLKKKLDELAAKEAEDANDDQAAGPYGYGEYGAPMADERGAEPAQGDETPLVDRQASERGTGTEHGGSNPYGPPAAMRNETPVAAATGSADPDPLGFGEIANEAPPAVPAGAPYGPGGNPGFLRPLAAAPPGAPGEARAAGAQTGPADPSQWKTSYEAFHANFSVARNDVGQPTVDWGQLADLKAKHENLAANDQDAINRRYGRPAPQGSQPSIEVTWEAAFMGLQLTKMGEHEIQFALPPLPEPLKIRFVLASDGSVDAWTALAEGQPVKFVGRLDVKNPHEILVQARLAE